VRQIFYHLEVRKCYGSFYCDEYERDHKKLITIVIIYL
jgi:hypothetical protein